LRNRWSERKSQNHPSHDEHEVNLGNPGFHERSHCSLCPRLYHWFIGIFLYPVASLVFTAVLIRPFFLLFGFDLSGRPLILTLVAVTIILSGWAYLHDYRRLCYTLFPDSLSLGRGTSRVRIPFSDIQSIVLGVPERMSWIMRIQRFNPKGRGVYRNIVRARCLTVLLRLRGGRYLPLNVAFSSLANGTTLMAEFLRLNEARIVGHETYTEREIEAFASGWPNTIKKL
jgi:hypothetical protein